MKAISETDFKQVKVFLRFIATLPAKTIKEKERTRKVTLLLRKWERLYGKDETISDR